MDVIVRLTLPNDIYRFYRSISPHISGATPESVMADALCAYAGMLSKDVHSQDTPEVESSSRSRSRKG